MTTAPEPSWTTPATCTRVIDGDTIEVEVTRKIRVRLLDCWAPETRTKDLKEKAKGLKSKQDLADWIEGKPVLVQIPTDSGGELNSIMTMGRVLGRVWTADGMDVAESQVAMGHATKTKQ